MAKFSNGATVYHAYHGAGTVISTREVDINGASLLCYVVDLMSGSRLLLPIKTAGRICALQNSDAIHGVLSAAPERLAVDYQVRHRQIEKKVNSGDQLQSAEVLRDLAWREYHTQLTNTDLRVMNSMKKRLIDILSAQPGMDVKQATHWLEKILKEIQLSWPVLDQPAEEVN